MSNKYTMSLSLNVLNHLGINLYSNIPAVLSEIVANSWDADAESVHITIGDDEITILDDGCGMDETDINKKFLFVGYQKREESKKSPKFNRKYMGRKGIGKLSMFSIANDVEAASGKYVLAFETNDVNTDYKVYVISATNGVQNLASYINVNSLRAIHRTMDKSKASGIDKVTKKEYEQNKSSVIKASDNLNFSIGFRSFVPL